VSKRKGTVSILRPAERTIEEWAGYVGEAWTRVAADLIVAGGRLMECRDQCDATEYVMVLTRLGMRPATAHKLIRIASCDRFDVRSTNTLPSSADVLLELAKLPDEEWELAAATGVINTDLTQAELRKFRKEAKPRIEKEEAERFTAARADPTVKVDPAAQEAFKREAALHGMVDGLARYFKEAEPDRVASEIDPAVARYVMVQLNPLVDQLGALADLLEARGGQAS
jgi:hypothetical protein